MSGFFFLFSSKFLRVDQDKDKDCSLDCSGSAKKPLCASDGRTFLSRCEFQRAKCKDPQLEIAYRGNCKGKFPSITVQEPSPEMYIYVLSLRLVKFSYVKSQEFLLVNLCQGM